MLTAETRNGGGGGSSSGARWSGVVSPPFLSFSSTAQPFFFSNQVGGMRGWRGWWSPNPAAKNPTVLSHLLLGFSTLGDGMVIRRGNLLFLPDFFFLDFFLLRFFPLLTVLFLMKSHILLRKKPSQNIQFTLRSAGPLSPSIYHRMAVGRVRIRGSLLQPRTRMELGARCHVAQWEAWNRPCNRFIRLLLKCVEV